MTRREEDLEADMESAMTRCGLMPDSDRSMGGLILSMERQVNCLQERVKLQASMIQGIEKLYPRT
jgi:hypothetical protein